MPERNLLPPSVLCDFAQLWPGALPNVYSHIRQRLWILNNVSLHKGTEKTPPFGQFECAVNAGNISIILGGNLKLGGLLSHSSWSFSRFNIKRDLGAIKGAQKCCCSQGFPVFGDFLCLHDHASFLTSIKKM